ncbi:hypothetical protein EWI07_10160 [Sporolactobacillus sp. THM7-4]|nr:hypothetical protein EWI07_10160 [Sporolactobacillus sp. THM7-4]
MVQFAETKAINDQLVIRFGQDVIEYVRKAQQIYGEDVVNQRINNVVREILLLLPLPEEE